MPNPDQDEPWCQTLDTYRGQLDEPAFGSIVPVTSTTLADRLATLHAMAAERFDQQAADLSSRADAADLYEQGAYGPPMISTGMLALLVVSMVGFSVDVFINNQPAGAICLALTLPLIAGLVWSWHRPPYTYTGGDRIPWDKAAELARSRATVAREKASRPGRGSGVLVEGHS
jgi:hypothetical protein